MPCSGCLTLHWTEPKFKKRSIEITTESKYADDLECRRI